MRSEWLNFVLWDRLLGRKASELYLWMKENATPEYRTLMGTSAPLDDKVTIPLQCADLYVGQLREFYIFGTCTDAMGVLMEQQFEHPFSKVGGEWTKRQLEEFAQSLDGLPENRWFR